MAEDKNRDRFYEAMPQAAAPGVGVAGTSMSGRQTISFLAGLALLLATLAGWWSALQANGQIFGIFAFNGWNTALALVAGVLALWAAFYAVGARTIWNTLAVVYAFMFVVGLIVGSSGNVIGLFANNYNNVWMYGALTLIFAYLGMGRQEVS